MRDVESLPLGEFCPDSVHPIDPSVTHRVLIIKGGSVMLSIQDYDRVAKFHWRAKQGDAGSWYALAHVPGSGKRGKSMLMHRFIMNAQPGQIIDHCDGWGLNNSRENLRVCSTAENIRNQRPHRDRKHSNRFKGITLMANGKWRAQITVNYKKTNLGAFVAPEEAARAYDKAALELHGEFACLNFPAHPSRHSRGSGAR